MKTLIIDAQIWQTNAWYRGMGGYTRSLISVLLKQNSDISTTIILNKNIPTDAERLKAIESELPGVTIHELDLPVDPSPEDQQHAKSVINKFIHTNFANQELTYFVPALFLFNYVAVFPDNVNKVTLFYDLIPLLYWEHLAQYFPPHLYFPRFCLLFEADVVFTISETTAKDLAKYLSLQPEKIINLDGSINLTTGDDVEVESQDSDIVKRLNLQNKAFFLMPTGGLPHKNNVRATQAFRQLRDTIGSKDMCLVTTSFFDELEREELRLIAGDDIVFTGNITDRDISLLYAACDVVLFPSLCEGLGIPVLEGIVNNKPVACSNIPVFNEIPKHEEALYMFDPLIVTDISEAMFLAMAKAGFEQKQTHYAAIMEKYSWQRSAGLFAETLASIDSFRAPAKISKKVAIVCPDPRKDEHISILTQRLYGYGLAAGIEFVYFLDPGNVDEYGQQFFPDYVRYIATSYDINDFYQELGSQQFDQVIYFPSDEVQFYRVLRAALKVSGNLYISHETYMPVIEKMYEEAMISNSQLQAERQVSKLSSNDKLFDNLTLLVDSPGILVTKAMQAKITKTVDKLGIKTKFLVLPEDSAAACTKIIDFLGEK